MKILCNSLLNDWSIILYILLAFFFCCLVLRYGVYKYRPQRVKWIVIVVITIIWIINTSKNNARRTCGRFVLKILFDQKVWKRYGKITTRICVSETFCLVVVAKVARVYILNKQTLSLHWSWLTRSSDGVWFVQLAKHHTTRVRYEWWVIDSCAESVIIESRNWDILGNILYLMVGNSRV